MADTTNFGWTKPVVDGSVNTWGTILNTLFDDIDTDLQTVKTTADDAMPKAGGTFTGDVEYGSGSRLVETPEAMSAYDVDWAEGNFFYRTLANGANVITFSNPPSVGKVQFITLELRQGSSGNSVVTWPAAVLWQDGVAPTLANIGQAYDVFVFYTKDGGTTYFGAHSITSPA